MKLLRLTALLLLCAWLPSSGFAQSRAKIAEVKISYVGPASVSDQLVRANIRVKAGDPFLAAATDDDVRNLYATGFFYDVRVKADPGPTGIVLTYILQGKPRLVQINFQGNEKYSSSKLAGKISSKPGDLWDERKLFTDEQEIQKMYQKAGRSQTKVKYSYSIDEAAGRATATFEITETPKVKIIEVDFVGAQGFTQRHLRKVVKTRKHWMFSWITGHGFLKDEELDDDRERLTEFYHDEGYIDFEIKDIQQLNPTPRSLVLRFMVYEGRRYKVGAIKFTGNKLFSTPELIRGLRVANAAKPGKIKPGPNGLLMDLGTIFKPQGFTQDIEAVEDFYGSRGFIDVTAASGNLKVVRTPNTVTGTMDLEFQIDEGQKSFIEKIEIRGNSRTKDKVIRRELSVAPGEAFDMVRVRRSRSRLEGMQYFSKVDARPQNTDIVNHKDLVISVDEGTTGHISVGAGFSSIQELFGYVELSEGNFDISQPPRFHGGGQKLRIRATVGTVHQEYIISFTEPWFFGHKLAFGSELYYRDLGYQSLNNIYDEIRAGGKLSLSRTLLNSDFFRGGVSYTLEDVGIVLNNPYHEWINGASGPTTSGPGPTIGSAPTPGGTQGGVVPPNIPNSILNEVGYNLWSRVGTFLTYDTRGGGQLPNRGQRTTLTAEVVGGADNFDREFYKLDLSSDWYFKGFAPGHVLEIGLHGGVAASFNSTDVPFYDRFYLGGMNTLRGYHYRGISPREGDFSEPIGGDTYWFGTAEYSIPIFEQERGLSLRFALFYDIGSVGASPYNLNADNYNDNWGVGLRINLPIAPIRLDYGIPIHHDAYNGSSGKFQFGVGFTREW